MSRDLRITGDDCQFWAAQRDRMLAMLAQGDVEGLTALIHATPATSNTTRVTVSAAIRPRKRNWRQGDEHCTRTVVA